MILIQQTLNIWLYIGFYFKCHLQIPGLKGRGAWGLQNFFVKHMSKNLSKYKLSTEDAALLSRCQQLSHVTIKKLKPAAHKYLFDNKQQSVSFLLFCF